ncbi:MAG: right-handed parallel beta-helix repeat-containing protein [Candidatus Brockarchaeota archaeon]|nr:right-handed parallel beta-helix repeat-containing protein [Candidatus Brockarchaeota archaeon]MBO3809353.1 right-handed parallel beta-helix repeat-containing protein [Candidatus Brockarchaeota archaeon]
MEKLVYTVFLMLALFTSQNVGDHLLPSADVANPHSFKNAAEKGFSIQTAINLADDGDTIYVPPGKYMENLKINKSLKLIANGTVELIPVNPGNDVIEISKDNVSLIGFIVLNPGGIRGIRVRGSSGYKIIGNKVIGGDFGFMVNGSSNGLLMGNDVRECSFGIYLQESFGNTLARNNVESSKYGVSLSLCFNNTIIENRVINCTYGFYSHISDENNVSKNVFKGNMIGVSIVRSRMTLLFQNEILYNFYGVYLDDARRSLVAGNNLVEGLIGIKAQGSQNVAILDNTVRLSTNNIAIDSSINVTVSGNTLEYARGHGIVTYETINNVLSLNSISFCRVGISVENSLSAKVEKNLVRQNSYGLYLFRSSKILLLNNRCVNNTITDFYSEGSGDIIVKNLEINSYGNSSEISFTYGGDVSIRGSRPVEFGTVRLLSGFFNLTLLSSDGWTRVNVTYSLKDIRDIQKEEPVLYCWTGVEWKTVRGFVAEESPSKGSASFLLTETGIYVLGIGEKTREHLPLLIIVSAVLALAIFSYLILKTVKARRMLGFKK